MERVHRGSNLTVTVHTGHLLGRVNVPIETFLQGREEIEKYINIQVEKQEMARKNAVPQRHSDDEGMMFIS